MFASVDDFSSTNYMEKGALRQVFNYYADQAWFRDQNVHKLVYFFIIVQFILANVLQNFVYQR